VGEKNASPGKQRRLGAQLRAAGQRPHRRVRAELALLVHQVAQRADQAIHLRLALGERDQALARARLRAARPIVSPSSR